MERRVNDAKFFRLEAQYWIFDAIFKTPEITFSNLVGPLMSAARRRAAPPGANLFVFDARQDMADSLVAAKLIARSIKERLFPRFAADNKNLPFITGICSEGQSAGAVASEIANVPYNRIVQPARFPEFLSSHILANQPVRQNAQQFIMAVA